MPTAQGSVAAACPPHLVRGQNAGKVAGSRAAAGATGDAVVIAYVAMTVGRLAGLSTGRRILRAHLTTGHRAARLPDAVADDATVGATSRTRVARAGKHRAVGTLDLDEAARKERNNGSGVPNVRAPQPTGAISVAIGFSACAPATAARLGEGKTTRTQQVTARTRRKFGLMATRRPDLYLLSPEGVETASGEPGRPLHGTRPSGPSSQRKGVRPAALLVEGTARG